MSCCCCCCCCRWWWSWWDINNPLACISAIHQNDGLHTFTVFPPAGWTPRVWCWGCPMSRVWAQSDEWVVKKVPMHSVSTVSPLAQEDVQNLGMQFWARWLQKFWRDPLDWIVCVSSMLPVEHVKMAFLFFRLSLRHSLKVKMVKANHINKEWFDMTEYDRMIFEANSHTSTVRNREAASKSVSFGWTASADLIPLSWDRCLARVRGRTVN